MSVPKFDADKHPAMILVLEAVAMTLMIAGASKEEAILGASRLFEAAHNEATVYLLECAMEGDE